ncbi:unnamed protein product [Gordionus sp. m RMFG-2023]
MKRGLHTLCLLDIKIQEKSIENIIKNRPIYEPPYFLTINKAIYQLLEISKSKLKEDPDNALINLSTKGFGLARMVMEKIKPTASTFSPHFAIREDCNISHPLRQ